MRQTLNDEYANASLIIGSDGTHSVVSAALFPEGNQVKYEFDFVLQLRFEITGESKASEIKKQSFFQQMSRTGLIANEYVGHFDQGKTPVTMQIMRSKKDFLALRKATSKKPFKLFATSVSTDSTEEKIRLPAKLNTFITNYLSSKLMTECEQVKKLIESRFG